MGFIDELGKTARNSGDVLTEKKNKQVEIREAIIQKSIDKIKFDIQHAVKCGIFDAPVGYREVTVEYDFLNSYDFIPNDTDNPGPILPDRYATMAIQGQKVYEDGVIMYTCKANQLGFDSKGYLMLTKDGIDIIQTIRETLQQDGIKTMLFVDALSYKNGGNCIHKKKEIDYGKKAKFWVGTMYQFNPNRPVNPTIPHVYYGLKCTVRF